jgi:RNA-dependent RNA polymerase
VPNAICFFGVMDETNTLSYGEVFSQLCAQLSTTTCPAIDEAYIEASISSSRILVGRNPSLHPGDLRLLTLVPPDRAPALKHPYDVILFPSQGPRPHSDEMSGGDLDGDIFRYL